MVSEALLRRPILSAFCDLSAQPKYIVKTLIHVTNRRYLWVAVFANGRKRLLFQAHYSCAVSHTLCPSMAHQQWHWSVCQKVSCHTTEKALS
jgi:hypothetical protein